MEKITFDEVEFHGQTFSVAFVEFEDGEVGSIADVRLADAILDPDTGDAIDDPEARELADTYTAFMDCFDKEHPDEIIATARESYGYDDGAYSM